MELFFMLKASIRSLLENELEHLGGIHNATLRPWTVQGFGMMRCYLDDDNRFRLNVWDSALSVPNVSIVHDHPWHLTSIVIAGKINNIRYEKLEGEPNFHYAEIKTGPGGGPLAPEKHSIRMNHRQLNENYYEGDSYQQRAEEIHSSHPIDGTVTLNDRVRVHGDIAKVFWPYGTEWVTAEPRAATDAEVERTIKLALRTFK